MHLAETIQEHVSGHLESISPKKFVFSRLQCLIPRSDWAETWSNPHFQVPWVHWYQWLMNQCKSSLGQISWKFTKCDRPNCLGETWCTPPIFNLPEFSSLCHLWLQSYVNIMFKMLNEVKIYNGNQPCLLNKQAQHQQHKTTTKIINN